MRIDIVSIFPEYLQPLKLSLIGKAVERGQVVLSMHDLRDFTHDRHRTVDDAPYGGGPGMVMSPQPWGEALDTVLTDESTLIVPTPSGQTFTRVRPRSWLSGRIWCSRAAAMKALMLASWSISAAAWRSARSASATTCSPAGKRRLW